MHVPINKSHKIPYFLARNKGRKGVYNNSNMFFTHTKIIA